MFYMAIENEQDRNKVKRLYEEYKNLMFSQANKILKDTHLAEDAVHQSFIRIMHNLHKIDEENCPRTRSFLVIICENVAKDIYNQKLYLNIASDTVELIEDEFSIRNPVDILISKESILHIKDMIEELDPIYRDVLLLRLTYKCNKEELAELLNISAETAKKRLYRARLLLKKRLEEEGLR